MSQDPRYWATAFINKFHTKKVSGGEMLKYLTQVIKKYGNAQYNKGFNEGRRQADKVWEEGRKVGWNSGYKVGYSEGINLAKEAPIWPRYKIQCMYDLFGINKFVTVSQIVSDFGVNQSTFYYRVKQGKSYKEALTLPNQKRGKASVRAE